MYARPDIILSKAKGAYVWDVEGRRYLDFGAGIAVNALGGGDGGVLKVRPFCSAGHFDLFGFRSLSDEVQCFAIELENRLTLKCTLLYSL